MGLAIGLTIDNVAHRHFPWFKLKSGLAIFDYCVSMPWQESAPHKVTINHITKRDTDSAKACGELLTRLA